jgi:alkanesulfonate monooxygenase SsuD/methylene tetrahydromethanopterin reductase-like flavin-dependent oxidoreductase (luciferase family)
VPIVVGGHTELAAKRAARYGDGFFPGVDDPTKLSALLAVMREECDKVGRDPATIELTAAGAASMDVDRVKRFQDLGVSRLNMAPPAFDPEGIERGLTRLHDEVIAKL